MARKSAMRDMYGERVQPAWGGPGTVVDLGDLSREELVAAIDSSPHLIVVRLDNDQHLEVWDADHVGMIRPDRNIEAELSKAKRPRATDLAALAVRCSRDLKGTCNYAPAVLTPHSCTASRIALPGVSPVAPHPCQQLHGTKHSSRLNRQQLPGSGQVCEITAGEGGAGASADRSLLWRSLEAVPRPAGRGAARMTS
jgi:hypothetical protein